MVNQLNSEKNVLKNFNLKAVKCSDVTIEPLVVDLGMINLVVMVVETLKTLETPLIRTSAG